MIHFECFTDGAYSSFRNTGGSSIVFLKNGEKIYEWSKSFKNTTNNRCELYAVVKALQAISKPIDKLTIYSDSKYVVNCANKLWSREKNIDLWKAFDIMHKKASKLCPNVEFKWVKGHSDNIWNNLADELAVRESLVYYGS